jgi:glycosyltransferase involved in cell wall biosynthesis
MTNGERQLWIWYSPFGLGGVETYLLSMARNAIAEGSRVAIASIQTDHGPLEDEFRGLGISHFAWSAFHEAFMGRTAARGICDTIVRDVSSFQPTLVGINDCSDFAIGTAPLLRQIRPYATIIDTLHIDAPSDDYLALRNSYLRVLDGIIGTNQHVVDRIRAYYRLDRATIGTRYIPNGVTVAAGQRHQFDGTLRIIYIGRVTQKQKRVFDLPLILAQLKQHGIDYAMTIAGEGSDLPELERRIQEAGLRHRVTLSGFVRQELVPSLLREHDVFLNASEYEGFSMSLIEALACGCIPVMTNLDSLDRQIFHNGENCLLFPVGDARSAAALLASLDEDRLLSLGANAESTGRTLTAEQTYASYRSLITSLRHQRPLRPWPRPPRLKTHWDLTKNNPWLPVRNPVRRLFRALTRKRH